MVKYNHATDFETNASHYEKKATGRTATVISNSPILDTSISSRERLREPGHGSIERSAPRTGRIRNATSGIPMSKSTLDNIQLENMCKGIPGFMGVFAKNMIPDFGHRKSGCAIVNLNDLGQAGSHWVAFWRSGDKSYYFDSFGAPPPEDVIKVLRPNTIVYNTAPIQDITSNACGWYCVDFLKAMSGSNGNYYDFLYSFDQQGSLENNKRINI